MFSKAKFFVVTILTLSAALMSPAKSNPVDPSAIETLVTEMQIIRVVDAIDRAVDDQNWVSARSHFADTVTIDFSSLTGQPPSTIPSDALIEGWSGNLKGTKSSLHLRTNHSVALDGDRAVVQSTGYAWNRMEGNGNPLWEVWGHYVHGLVLTPDGWKVDAFTFVMTHERGNEWVKTTPGS